MEIKITGMGEFRSFSDGDEHEGFLRVLGPHGEFDLPVSREQLEFFLGAILQGMEEGPPPPPPIPRDTVPESSSNEGGQYAYNSPAFGDDFDLDDEPIRLRRTYPPLEDDVDL
jgi:hypothetical protein